MKVARYKQYGGVENIEVTDQPDPTPRPSELLVDVHASSVNPVDWKIAAGEFPMNLLRPAAPYIPGFDVAGVCLNTAGGFTKGERVFVRLPGLRGGASAERVCFDPVGTARIPEGMSDHDAAAIPLAGMTALQGLHDEGRLPREGADGKRVLVVGASGGVGHFGVQLAKAAGAHVTGVCSTRNVDLVRSLGADAVIDYTRSERYDEGGAYDLILDCVGHDPVGRFTPWLAPKGSYVSCLPNASVFARQFASTVGLGPRVRGVMLRPNAKDLTRLATLYTAAKLRVVIDEVFPLERLADAHAKSIRGRAQGKIVVAVAPR